MSSTISTSTASPAAGLLCDRQAMASLLCSPDPAVEQFADELIICTPENLGTSVSSGSAAVPDSLRALIANLLKRPSGGKPRHFSLSPAGSALLLEYAQASGRLTTPL